MAALSTGLAHGAFSNTWSIEAGSAARAVFAFGDGLRITWAGSGDGEEPHTLQVWVDPSADWWPDGIQDDEPMPCPVPGVYDWGPRAQTWSTWTTSACPTGA